VSTREEKPCSGAYRHGRTHLRRQLREQIYEGTNQVNARIALLKGAASLDAGRVLTTMLRGLAVMSRYELQRRPALPAVENGEGTAEAEAVVWRFDELGNGTGDLARGSF
jgi:hypothetical protein